MKLRKIFILILSIIMIISIIPVTSYAGDGTDEIASSTINPNEYKPNVQTSTKLDNIGDEIADTIQTIGSILSVIVLMIIGIMYMVGSTEDKANYKETMFPYVLGAFFVFGISRIIGIVKDVGNAVTNNATSASDIGNILVTVIGTVGSVTSVVVLVIIGIKYMMGSVDEKANYKKSLMPYVIGAGLVFAASNIASVIYNLAI